MEEISENQQAILQVSDAYSEEYLRNVQCMPEEMRKDLRARIDKLNARAGELGDVKIRLTGEIYNMVDGNINRLDAGLARFREEIAGRAAKVANAVDHHQEVRPRTAEKDDKRHDVSNNNSKKSCTSRNVYFSAFAGRL